MIIIVGCSTKSPIAGSSTLKRDITPANGSHHDTYHKKQILKTFILNKSFYFYNS